jgi:hypothetical protein
MQAVYVFDVYMGFIAIYAIGLSILTFIYGRRFKSLLTELYAGRKESKFRNFIDRVSDLTFVGF